jgi:hypothetical protein
VDERWISSVWGQLQTHAPQRSASLPGWYLSRFYRRMSRQQVTCDHKHEEKNMKSNSLVRETSNDVLSPYVVTVAIKDDIAAEVTARAMGWEPVEREDGTTIWVR